MNRSKKTSGARWIGVVAIVVLALGMWHAPVDGAVADSLQNLLTVGGREDVELLNRLNAAWTLPEDYHLDVIEVKGITMEWLRAKDNSSNRAILQLHGGAYMRSLKDNGTTYRRAAVQYARLSHGAVLTVDYRVAPEHPFPAALEDALLAYKWLLEQGFSPEEIIIVGDSAGGGLALATVLYLRDHEMPLPAAVITMSAWTDLDYRLWTPPYVGNASPNNPYISPIYGEYHGFPPMLMQVGGDELLLNDTIAVAQRAKAAGVFVQQSTYPGMFHVFQMLFPELPEANEAWREVELFIHSIYRED